MKLTHNTNYKVIAEGGALFLISNETLKKQIEKEGFTNVQVTGAGIKRTATGHWPLATQEKEFPKVVSSVIKSIEAV
jgi:hypothetical protein